MAEMALGRTFMAAYKTKLVTAVQTPIAGLTTLSTWVFTPRFQLSLICHAMVTRDTKLYATALNTEKYR